MAVYDFATRIRQGRPITVFNHGHNRRAFTFIDDVVSGIIACLAHPPQDLDKDQPPYKVSSG